MNEVTTRAGRLTLDDILDLRAYERRRPDLLRRILALKRHRRIAVGPFVTVTFENRETMQFQVQEMARAEKMTTDAQIQVELDVYNPLIPEHGELSATLFIELTSRAELEEWLPKLVGIERAVELRLGAGHDIEVVHAEPEEAHAQQLTRDDVTASVHYIRFRLSGDQIARFSDVPVVVATNLPAYREEVALSVESRAELRGDLQSQPAGGDRTVTDEPTEKITEETKAAERRDARAHADPGRGPTPEEELLADEQDEVEPAVAASIEEQYERGARQKGEGRIA